MIRFNRATRLALMVEILCVSIVLAVLIIGDLGTRTTAGAATADTSGKAAPVSLVAVQDSQPVAGYQIQRRNDPELRKLIRKYDLLKLNAKQIASQIQTSGTLRLRTSTHDFELRLTPHDLRAKDYRAQAIGADGSARELLRGPVNTYIGHVKGMARAQARLTITKDIVQGAIITETGRYFLQPARSLSRNAQADEFVFYSDEDVTQQPLTCGVTLAEQVAVEADRKKAVVDDKLTSAATIATQATTLVPMKMIRLATEADAEYVTALGGPTQANNHILSIMNQVDGIYQFELGITFQIVFQNAWTDPATDPYSSSVSGTRLNQFAEYWKANFRGVTRDAAHLWTGSQLDVLGLASLGSICRLPADGFALSTRVPDNPSNPITSSTIGLTAHEIGHNLGAAHTDLVSTSLPFDISQNCRNTIMETLLGSTTFCEFSRSQILGFLNTWNCLLDSPAQPPSFPNCVETPIDFGVIVNGALTETDCRSPSRGVRYLAERYAFNGQAGQRLSITMSPTGSGLAPYLYLLGPDGYILAQDSNSLPNPARLPALGSITLPDTGKYVIETTSSTAGQTGNFTLSVTLYDCVLTVSPVSQHFPADGGNGIVNVTATGNGCGEEYFFTHRPNSVTWLTTQSGPVQGSHSFDFNVQPNNNPAGRTAFLVIGAASATFTGGLQVPITQSGTAPDCSLLQINFGQTVAGSLTLSDCHSPLRGNFHFADRYVFSASAGQQVAVSMSSPMDGFLALLGPDGRTVFVDDDGGAFGNARIPASDGWLKLGLSGTYVIEVTSFSPSPAGAYLLTLSTPSPPILLTEADSVSAIGLSSVTSLRGPFALTDPFNLSSDHATRVVLFATNLDLLPGETNSAVTAVGEDGQMNVYPLTVESVRKVPGFDWVRQIVIKLPPNLPAGQDLLVSITAQTQTSNKARLRIK